MLGRLVKWAVELGEFDISYHPMTVVKGQVLADLVTYFVGEDPNIRDVGFLDGQKECPPLWQLWIDGVANKNGSRVGLVVTT